MNPRRPHGEKRAGFAVAVGGGVHLPIPVRAKNPQGREVVVGVRPEHSRSRRRRASGSGGGRAHRADTQIFCKLAGVDVTAVVRERHAFQPAPRCASSRN